MKRFLTKKKLVVVSIIRKLQEENFQKSSDQELYSTVAEEKFLILLYSNILIAIKHDLTTIK